jgi:hypothetical protein
MPETVIPHIAATTDIDTWRPILNLERKDSAELAD